MLVHDDARLDLADIAAERIEDLARARHTRRLRRGDQQRGVRHLNRHACDAVVVQPADARVADDIVEASPQCLEQSIEKAVPELRVCSRQPGQEQSLAAIVWADRLQVAAQRARPFVGRRGRRVGDRDKILVGVGAQSRGQDGCLEVSVDQCRGSHSAEQCG